MVVVVVTHTCRAGVEATHTYKVGVEATHTCKAVVVEICKHMEAVVVTHTCRAGVEGTRTYKVVVEEICKHMAVEVVTHTCRVAVVATHTCKVEVAGVIDMYKEVVVVVNYTSRAATNSMMGSRHLQLQQGWRRELAEPTAGVLCTSPWLLK
ncbi:UNVERIFIED_CONTAM: hypothetical protein Slati_3664800 [Sesamum latifolium]|uniref:Uncharacterized protein n=1 Tax=Sesamum latifolium TaxID=2727402 RepID=A0AAW2U0G0_9LAMI